MFRCMSLLFFECFRMPELPVDQDNRSKKDQFPEIYWSQIVGMRNRLIHGYIAVDYDVLWDVVHDDLPELISKLKKIIG